MRTIYLDYNATTPVAPAAQQAMLPFLAEQYGNPNSNHALGRAAAKAIDEARRRVAHAIGAEPDEVYFTASGSQSCRAGTTYLRAPGPAWVLTSELEHRCVRSRYARDERVSSTRNGVIDLESLRNLLRDAARPISVVHANNEIGTIQPVRSAADICRERAGAAFAGPLVHSDAVQSFGKVVIDVKQLGVDLLSVTAHKVYGPKGIGAIYIRRGIPIHQTFNNGATLSDDMPDVAAIVGFGVAAELAIETINESAGQLRALRERLRQRLHEGVGEGLIVWGDAAERLPNTLAVAFPGVLATALLAACPGVCATALAGQINENVQLSHTLKAIGADPEAARGSVRFSVGWYTDEDEIDRAASMLLDAWERLRVR